MDYPLELDWIKAAAEKKLVGNGNERIVRYKLGLEFERQPLTVNLKLKSKQPFKILSSNVVYSQRKKTARIRWFSFPEKVLSPEFEIRLPQGAEVEGEIIADFLETPLAVTGEGTNIHFIHRAEIIRKIDWDSEVPAESATLQD
jgi:hypothetical protein